MFRIVRGQNFVKAKLPGWAAFHIVERGQCRMAQIVPGKKGAATLPTQGLRFAVTMARSAVPALEGYKIWIGHLMILPDQGVRVTFCAAEMRRGQSCVNKVAGRLSGGI